MKPIKDHSIDERERIRAEEEAKAKAAADAAVKAQAATREEMLTSQQPLSDARLRQIHVMDEFGLFCDYDEFEQIAREIEQAHGIFQKRATGEKEQEARDVTQKANPQR